MSDNLIADLGTISIALNRTTGRLTLDEIRSIVFSVKNVSTSAQMTADDIVQQSYKDSPSSGPQFTHAAVNMLTLTIAGISRLQRVRA